MRCRAAAARHLERRAEAVHRHETELPRGVRVAATCDQYRAEAMRRGVAGAPLDERLQRMAGTPGAIVLDRAASFTAAASASRIAPMSPAVRGSKKSAR